MEEARCDHCGIAVSPGGWSIVRQLATGPHSRVFLAEKNGQQVALKELLFALVPDAALLEGFEREARLLAQLKHPAIPRLIESFTEGKGVHTRLYLAQEFVRGRSLLDQLDNQRFDEAEGKRLARSLLDILGYLHGLSPRVIHRDIKPANVMRREDGSLALVDFGAARDLVRGVTHGSTLVGTFGYMPPEQLGGTVDLTADLYALGATLLHLLSRKPPDELLKLGMQLEFDEAVNVSAPLRGWLKKLVARERSARFQSAKEARDALDALDQAPARPAVRAAAKQRVPWLAAVAAAGVLAISGLILLTRGAGPEPQATIEAVATVPIPPQSTQPEKVREIATVAPPSRVEVTTIAKAKPLPPFALAAPFSVALGTKLPISGNACEGASFEVVQVAAAPGSPDTLVLSSALENASAQPACSNVYVELVDQAGARDPSRATLLSNSKIGTTARKETKFKLPANNKKVQLRVGPQSKPYGVFDIDLAKGTAVPR